MGIIQKQSIKGSIFLYIGVIIGFVVTTILFPKILSTEQIGLINTLVAYSIIFAQFSTLGFNITTIRMFPFFRNNKKNHNGFLVIALIVVLIGFIFFMIIFFFIKPIIINENIEKSPLLINYIHYLIPLTFFTLVFFILDSYNQMLYNSVRGIFIKEFLQRAFILISILLMYFAIVNFKVFTIFYTISLSLPAIIIIFLLIKDKQFILKPNFSYINKDLINTMLSVSLFSILTGISGMAVMQIDRIMLSSMLGLGLTGIYTTCFFFATVIKIPSRAIIRIASVVISDAWKDNDLKTISSIYKSTGLNQFIMASIVFIGIWANIDNIFEILPKSFETGKYVIFFIGFANVFEMMIGANSVIISTSMHYKYITYFTFIYLVLIVIMNIILIPIWYINGAAIASMISIIIYNIIKLLFLWKKYKIQPFNYKYLIVIAISIVSFLFGYIVPKFSFFITDIIIRSSIISVSFISMLLFFKVSTELNKKFNQIYRQFIKLISTKVKS